MSIETGGPAFPVSTTGTEGHQDSAQTWQYAGMTLRDYFAAKALGMLAYTSQHKEDMAKEAYEIADAMLAARRYQGEQQ